MILIRLSADKVDDDVIKFVTNDSWINRLDSCVICLGRETHFKHPMNTTLPQKPCQRIQKKNPTVAFVSRGLEDDDRLKIP